MPTVKRAPVKPKPKHQRHAMAFFEHHHDKHAEPPTHDVPEPQHDEKAPDKKPDPKAGDPKAITTLLDPEVLRQRHFLLWGA